ncbi:polysaccharide biosynthesis/export family protein [Falsiroseomonas sp. HW251]|uniref:polysaccharide biosynthesis/export family protein n=1 Tax=Falsiroseomonas sp. HW251 TaxID=3390998 RepID=UPI003D30FED8
MTSRRSLLVLAPTALLAAGCANFLPSAGPRFNQLPESAGVRAIEADGGQRVWYAYVPLTPNVVSRLEAEERPMVFGRQTVAERAFDPRIGIGDTLHITVFEASSGGLFIPPQAGARPGNFIQLPPQQVGRGGTITVPYAGAVRAEGLTPAELSKRLEDRLAGRALEPQVIVQLGDRRSNLVSVMGDVYTSLQFPLDPAGERLLNALSRAGGPRFPAYETVITLQRGRLVDRALLSDIAGRPEQNIQLRAGDVVFVSREPRYFLALGATGPMASLSPVNRRMPFEDTRLNLGDAIARAGGLQDDRADSRAVFVFRNERARVLAAIGLQVPPGNEELLTVYQADMSEPSGLFLANAFPMRNRDTMFVSAAAATDVQKVVNLLLPFANTGIAIGAVSNR